MMCTLKPQTIYTYYSYTIVMEKIFQTITIISLIVALFATVSIMVKQANAQIFEDQLLVCNFESVCTVIDIDDYMNKQKSDHLWSIFNNDIDTFYSGEDVLK